MAPRCASGLWGTLPGGRRDDGAATCALRGGRGAGINFGAILQFVQAVYNHEVAGIQAGAQADTVAGGLRDSHDSNLRGVVGIVAVVGIDGKLDTRMELGVYLRKLILRKTENHRDRLELGDDEKSVGV